MPEQFQGDLNAENLKFAIVVGRFNRFICQSLLDGALDCLYRHHVKEPNITIYWVPGAFEIPLAAKRVAQSKKYDAVICVGAVIRGETPHFDYVANEVTKGIAQLNLELAIPLSYGIITADSTDQAIERSGNKVGNKGFDAARSAIEMLNLFKSAKI